MVLQLEATGPQAPLLAREQYPWSGAWGGDYWVIVVDENRKWGVLYVQNVPIRCYTLPGTFLMAMIVSIYLEHEGIIHLAKKSSYQVREPRFKSRSKKSRFDPNTVPSWKEVHWLVWEEEKLVEKNHLFKDIWSSKPSVVRWSGSTASWSQTLLAFPKGSGLGGCREARESDGKGRGITAAVLPAPAGPLGGLARPR